MANVPYWRTKRGAYAATNQAAFQAESEIFVAGLGPVLLQSFLTVHLGPIPDHVHYRLLLCKVARQGGCGRLLL